MCCPLVEMPDNFILDWKGKKLTVSQKTMVGRKEYSERKTRKSQGAFADIGIGFERL